MKRTSVVLRWCLLFLLFWLSALPACGQPAANDPLEAPLPVGAISRLGTTRFRAGNWAEPRAISRDGKRLLTSGAGGFVPVWNVATGQLLRRIAASPVCGQAEFSSDGNRVLINDHVQSGNTSSSMLKIYDIGTGKLVRALEGPRPLGTFALSPDGRTLALEFVIMERRLGPSDFIYKSHLEQRDLETDRVLHSFGEQRTTALMGWLFFSADGKSLFAVSAEMGRTPDVKSTVRHFDRATARLKGQFMVDCVYYGASRLVRCDKGLLVTGNNNSWDLEKGRLQTRLVGGEKLWSRGEGVNHLMPDGKTAVVVIPARNEAYQGRYGASVREAEPARWVLWDIDNDKEIRRLPDHWNGYLSLDSKSSFTVSMSGAIRHWDLATGKEVLPLDGDDNNACAVRFSPDQKRLIRCAYTPVQQHLGRELSVWDLATSKRLHRWRIEEIPHIHGLMHFTPDSRTVLIGGTTQLHTLDMATARQGKRELEGLGLEPDSADFAHCQLSPDGKTLAVSCSNIRGDAGLSNTVLLWDWTTGKKIGQLALKDREMVSLRQAKPGKGERDVTIIPRKPFVGTLWVANPTR